MYILWQACRKRQVAAQKKCRSKGVLLWVFSISWEKVQHLFETDWSHYFVQRQYPSQPFAKKEFQNPAERTVLGVADILL